MRGKAKQEEISPGTAQCFLAAQEGSAVSMAAYLKRGADVRQLDRLGVLGMLASAGSLEAARLLLEAGDAPNAAMVEGQVTPLMQAAKAGRLELVKLLIESGADLNETEKKRFWDLSWAVRGGNLEIVKLLLEQGVPVDVPHSGGGTCVMTAVSQGNKAILRHLISAGAHDPSPSERQDRKDRFGAFVLRIAEGLLCFSRKP